MKTNLKILLMVLLFFFVVIISTNVNAAYFSELSSGGVVTQESENHYKLNRNITGILDGGQDIFVQSGENITLDLNGKQVTNYTATDQVIKVEHGGTLTIKDSQGNAQVSLGDGSTYCVICNEGTLTIEGGTYTTDLNDNGIIENFGTLNINGGTFKLDSETSKHSVIYNESVLNITNGTFSTNADHSVISNKGTLSMTGGSVTTERLNSTNYLIDNMKDLTIGGTATITKGASSAAAIGNIPLETNEKVTR